MSVSIFTTTNFDGTTTDYAVITNPDGSQTSMPKSVYDTLPSESSIPSTPQAGA